MYWLTTNGHTDCTPFDWDTGLVPEKRIFLRVDRAQGSMR